MNPSAPFPPLGMGKHWGKRRNEANTWYLLCNTPTASNYIQLRGFPEPEGVFIHYDKHRPLPNTWPICPRRQRNTFCAAHSHAERHCGRNEQPPQVCVEPTTTNLMVCAPKVNGHPSPHNHLGCGRPQAYPFQVISCLGEEYKPTRLLIFLFCFVFKGGNAK